MLDSGIDATHPAFARRDGDAALTEAGARPAAGSRVSASYDFTGLRALLAEAGEQPDASRRRFQGAAAQRPPRRLGPAAPAAPVPHDETYLPPTHEHGTHVAGTLAGDWFQTDPGGPDHNIQGVCPDMELYDLRVFDAGGAGDEFAILAALQYVRWVNSNAASAGHPRRQPLALARPRGRRLRVRTHTGVR